MRWCTLLFVAGTMSCGSLPADSEGVVSLEVITPDVSTLPLGQSLTLRARARNLQGDSVAATVYWRTPDTALVALDTTTGVVVARASSGSARIQAHVGTLISNVITITLRDTTTTIRRAR